MSLLMRSRFGVPFLLLVAIAGGCLVPHYGVEPPGGGGGGTASTAGSAGMPAQAGSGGSGTAPGDCDADQKVCDGKCVGIDDPDYGCTATSCNKSGCPEPGTATLGCEGGACVIGSCGTGTKKCGGKCVSVSDPTYGCSETSCDALGCPDPKTGTLICNGTSCEVGECGADTKNCASKCVPLDENNGCADTAVCSACQSNERCLGTPAPAPARRTTMKPASAWRAGR